jgi:hypothetical protein
MEYIKYDIATELSEEGFPRPIVPDWPGLAPDSWSTKVFESSHALVPDPFPDKHY